LKNNIKIHVQIYNKTAPTYFGFTVTPSLLICARINVFPDDGVTVTQKHVGAYFNANFNVNFNIF